MAQRTLNQRFTAEAPRIGRNLVVPRLIAPPTVTRNSAGGSSGEMSAPLLPTTECEDSALPAVLACARATRG